MIPCYNSIPFNPFDEIKLTLTHQGYYPSITVQHDLLPPMQKEKSNDVDEDSLDDSDYASDEDPSDMESIFDDILCDEVLDDDEDVQT